jgi:hypothetical protein
MSESSEPTEPNPLVSYYHQYIGDPTRTSDIYAGFGLFFLGLGLALAGIVVFLYSATLDPTTDAFYAIRQLAGVSASVGLLGLLLGIVVLLPVDRRMLAVAGGGVAVCLVAVVRFVTVYPYNWNVESAPDYSAEVVAIYSVGFVLLIAATGVALVAHRVDRAAEGTAAETDTEEAEEETVTDAEVQADIDRELGDAELSWGGVEKRETTRLELDTGPVDDVDRESLPESGIETRTGADGVDDAVSQLKGLQGGDVETTSGESTDDQATALRELREQQQEADDGEPSLLSRILARLQDLF